MSYRERNLHLVSNREEKVFQCQIRNQSLRRCQIRNSLLFILVEIYASPLFSAVFSGTQRERGKVWKISKQTRFIVSKTFQRFATKDV
jgi:hypothetical protein